MKNLKKLTAVVLIGILALGLVACGTKTPTDVVNEYFSEIKKGDNSELNDLIEDKVKTGDAKEDKEVSKDTEKAMTNVIKQIDGKATSEKIDGDNATVNVTVKGPNISQMMLKFISQAMQAAFSGKQVTDAEMEKMLQESFKNPPTDERTGEIHLTKKDNEWKIQTDDGLMNVVLGKAEMPNKK